MLRWLYIIMLGTKPCKHEWLLNEIVERLACEEHHYQCRECKKFKKETKYY